MMLRSTLMTGHAPRIVQFAALGLALLVLAGCAGSSAQRVAGDADDDSQMAQAGVAVASSPWAQASRITNRAAAQAAKTIEAVADQPVWMHRPLPGKRHNQWVFDESQGRAALRVQSHSGTSVWQKRVNIAPEQLGKIAFSWKVDDIIAKADLALRESDDAPVRLVLAFDGDRDKLSGGFRAMSELARALTGEELPYATLMYVWCNKRPVDTVVNNPRTDRIRKIVVESGKSKVRQWRDYERDIKADFEKAFGEAPGALIGVGVMTDTDNTKSRALAWYGPVRLRE